MSNNYLIHFRTPGSKNGERRYQYEDGTWTPEGLQRRRAEYRKLERRDGSGLRAFIGGGGSGLALGSAVAGVASAKNPTQASLAVTNSKNLMNDVRNAADTFKTGKIKPSDVYTQDLSNDELNAIVKRMTLEKQYADLLENDRDKGSDWVTKFMGTIGGLLAAGASIAVIYSAIKGNK